MTKAELVKILNEKIGFSKKECQELVDLVFETMKEVLVKEGRLKLSGFGIFEVRHKKPRRGRNPQTNESMTISERRVLVFRTSPLLKKRLNESVSQR